MDYADYFKSKNLKKTESKQGIHFEQKTTPDLIWATAQSILDYIDSVNKKEFTDKNIRQTEVFEALREEHFTKPKQDKAKNEYNKLTSYQLNLLAYADILSEIDQRPKKYKIIEKDILKNLAKNDREVSKFLGAYLEKFLEDNDLKSDFERYKEDPTQESYRELKDKYWKWAKKHTNVKTNNPRHSNRVFNKIFNLYAYYNRLPGEKRGWVKKGVCPYNFLIYNRPNFRDEEKPSDMTRQEFEKQQKKDAEEGGIARAMINKAKAAIKNRHSESEIQDESLGYSRKGLGIHVHRIFPENEHPQLSFLRENMIALTPGQHLSWAHPKGETTRISKEFQIISLIAKLKSIKESLKKGDGFYKKSNFIRVLNKGLGWEISEDDNIAEIQDRLEHYKRDID